MVKLPRYVIALKDTSVYVKSYSHGLILVTNNPDLALKDRSIKMDVHLAKLRSLGYDVELKSVVADTVVRIRVFPVAKHE